MTLPITEVAFRKNPARGKIQLGKLSLARMQGKKTTDRLTHLLVFDPDAPLPDRITETITAAKNRIKKSKKWKALKQQRKGIDYSLFEADGIKAPPDEAKEQPEQPAPAEPAPAALPVVRPAPVPLAAAAEVVKYGLKFPPGTNPLTIELAAYRLKRSPEQGGLGTYRHLKNVIDMLWNRPGSPVKWVWTPWAEQFMKAACETQYLGVAGCAGSGKSYAAAVLAIVEYLCSPHNTIVILTSTTLREARKRIWKGICEYWAAVPGLPGKMVDSLGTIRGINSRGEPWDGSGIVLIPAEKSSEKDALGKLIGIHQDRVVLMLDEATELPESIYHAAKTNLSQNPYFALRALANPASYYDTFSLIAAPKHGWASVSEDDHEWETDSGKLIRFDAEESPNVLAGKEIYPWLPTREKIEAIRTQYGEKSLGFYRMVKGFWPPEGVSNGIYAEADLVRGLASTPAAFEGQTTRIAGLDLSFTHGGDRTIAFFGTFGSDKDGKKMIQFDDWVLLKEDITSKGNPRAFQIAQQFIAECASRGVSARNAGFDSTSGGSTFGDVLAVCWNQSDFLRVNFSGNASARPISATDKTLAKDRYKNRMSEIWYMGAELIRSGQLRGVSPALARELCSRNYETTDGGKKIRVEAKREYISRVGKSPDLADAAMIMLDVARQRFGFAGAERFDGSRERQNTWKQKLTRLDSVYASVNLAR